MLDKFSARLTCLLLLVATLAGCLDDATRPASLAGDGTYTPPTTSAPGSSSGFQKLVLSGVPVHIAIEGSLYTFQPYAEAPGGQTVDFAVTNKPRWASFDTSTGRLSGRPSGGDVGAYTDIRITASAGGQVAEVGPFEIDVHSATSASAESTFTFAEMPEISFVRGYPELENLGPWHVDTGNRWTPGDLGNVSGWAPRVVTELQLVDGSLSGITYDAATAELRYDGSGTGGWARVKLVAPARSAESNEFYIRVLVPKAIWGKDATVRSDIASRFPGVPKFDYGAVSFGDAWNAIPKSGSEHDPDFVLVLGGDYVSTIEARLTGQLDPATGAPDAHVTWQTNTGGGDRPWFYLIGEPGNRPRFSGYDIRSGGIIAIPGYRVTVFRNVELETMVTDTSGKGWVVGVPNRKFWSKIYAHDTHDLDSRPQWPDVKAINDDVFGSHSAEGDTTDSYVRRGVPKSPNDWKSWFWGNRFVRTGGNSLKHTIYLHGRPDAWLIYNNNSHNGGANSSAIKATVGHLRVLNSRLSAFADDANPGDPDASMNQQLIDVPSSSDVVIFNNELIGGRRMVSSDISGTRTGLIWFNPRRTLWGTDDPRYPDVTYQAAPFAPFSFEYRNSGLSSNNYPTARAEIRKRDGEWQPLAMPPVPADGRAENWNVTVQPADVPINGAYELRMNGGDRVSDADNYILLTVYRNAGYLAVTSFVDASLTSPWYADGPKAYVLDDGAEYWNALRTWGNSGGDGRADPTNPYTNKKYVAYNRFVWRQHSGLDDKREEAIRDNGSYPSVALYTGSAASRLGAVPASWTDKGVTFLLNNVYEGWRVEDMGTASWMRTDVKAIQDNSMNELHGPGQDDPLKSNWPHYFQQMPSDRQPLIVPVGGERTPASPATAFVTPPPWYELF